MTRLYAVRKINYQGSMMVNICDRELIGTKLNEGKLEVNLSKNYFGHETVGEEEVATLLKSCSVANLVGKRIVEKALSMKLASSLSVRVISGIPFLMIFKFQHSM